MDWDLKMPWDLGELDPNAESINMGSMVGPSTGHLDCSVDLKLSGFGDFGLSEKWKEQQRISMPSSSSKRARAPNNSNQNVSCSVDGCKADLSNCREYHRRHKVCEFHSKTPVGIVRGQEQRFCQQCSRFHLLVEFDEVKRSCRKRLDGHNRRRRKPQPESINSGSSFTNHQGNRFLPYSHLFPTCAADPNWPIMVKTEEDRLYSNHPPPHILNPQQHHFANRGDHHFPFLQESRTGSNNNKIFSNGLAHVIDSDCALSLLSSPQLSQIVTDRIPMGQSLLSYGGSLGLGHKAPAAAAASNNIPMMGFPCSGMDTGDHDMSCQGLCGSDDGGGSQTLPLSWH